MFYPYSTQLQTAAKSFNKGNFSLWFNKLIPLNNENKCKPCNKQGKDKEAVQYYETIYNGLKNNITLKNLLDEKHRSQKQYCKIYEKAGYEIINLKATLKSPLITGIGQPHPNEVGIVFDHTMGIPYIPASSIKGIVRFAHMLGLINSNKLSEYLDKDGEFIVESNLQTKIPVIFGGDADIIKNGKKEIEKRKGKVIFLDAYPENVPDLHVDIMNPHYGQYYSDDENKIPPADYLDPTPITFLTVKLEIIFKFRALVLKESSLLDAVKKAYQDALENEGVGAKTAVGYGRFDIITSLEKDSELIGSGSQEAIKAIQTPLEKLLKELDLIRSNDMGRIGTIIQKIDTLETDADKGEVAKAIKEKIGAKLFKKHKKREYLLGLIAKT